VALPVESDPITLAKTIATLDHLSGGRVTIGAGYGWNTDELEEHHFPTSRRRTVLKEYVEAMRALWTQDEAAYDGEFVSFGPSWAYPKPVQDHVPLIIGAGGGPKTFQWVARHADGWMTTPTQTDIEAQVEALKSAWADAGRDGIPDIRVLIAFRPNPDDLVAWADAGVSELIWGVPDSSPADVLSYLDKLAGRLRLAPA
jgi:probable F420-dependent oxidoreductase